MRFIEFFIKYQLIFVFFLIILNYQSTNSQESELNKIIIENDFGKGRLLSPPTQGTEKKIKLIPPKSVLEKDKKKLNEIRKVKEREEKNIKSKKDSEILRKKKGTRSKT